MNYLGNMFQVLLACIALLVQKEPGTFGITLLSGVVLAALCWWAATHYSRLFNLTFQITRLHQILCAFAALLTLVFCVFFVSLKFTKQIAQAAVDSWDRKVTTNSWQFQTCIKIYYAVKARGEEDFRKFPTPDSQNCRFPLNMESSKRLVASLSANEALHLFQRVNPYLSHVLSLPARVPEGPIMSDQAAFFALHPGATYPTAQAINLTAANIKGRLDPETPKAVLYARFILTFCFLLAQAIPFFWIGYAAYLDLRVGV
jgi:hypothetical protein